MLKMFKKNQDNKSKEANGKATKKVKKSSFFGFRKSKKEKIDKSLVKQDICFLDEFSHLNSDLVKQQYITKLQYRLIDITSLKKSFLADFKKIYKAAYFISNNNRVPRWLEFYDLLFIGEGRAVIISKYNTSVGPLLDIEEIMNSDLKIDSLNSIFFKLEFLINQMIKMYNEGKNRNYYFKDSVNELKYLGLINDKLYSRLLFISTIRSKVGRAWNINEIRISDSNTNRKGERLHNKKVEFKALLSESYLDLVEIYMAVQKPYLRKFSLLWSNKKLFIDDPVYFYHI